MSRVLAISGGVGGAKLSLGLARVLPAADLTIVANTADDFEHLGLQISPDLDTVMYTLANLNDPARGWGLAGESWQCMEALQRLGGETWFKLGDRDLATHLQRSALLAQGFNLTEVTATLCRRLGVAPSLLPMSDDPVRTVVLSDAGELPFQRYFVEHRCEPAVSGFRFEGLAQARPQSAFMAMLADTQLAAIIICPSNPFVSIDPVLSLDGVRDALVCSPAPVIAVSPIVGGVAIRGPAAKMMRELALSVSAQAVAAHYQGLVDCFVLDAGDAKLVPAIESLGMDVQVVPTIMHSLEDREQLARELLAIVGHSNGVAH